MFKNMLVVSLALCGMAAEAAPMEAPDIPEAEYLSGKALEESVQAGWRHVIETCYSPKTHLIYATNPERVSKAKDFKNGLLFFSDGKGYGFGMEDCAIVNGVALSMLVDQFAVTKAEQAQSDARNIFTGLISLATAHGHRGFVARGLCVEDGRSICALSSRDQVTHFIHGLWRYYHSPLADENAKAQIRAVFKDVAARMHRNVTPENDYNFLQADDSPDPRGICKMRQVYPHEAARLPMVYAAAFDVTGDATYHAYYEECANEGLSTSLQLPELPGKRIQSIMPSYTLLQMQSSLELLSTVDAKRRDDYLKAMDCPAKLGTQRAISLNGRDERWLCASGETLLAQLMTPDYPFPEQQQKILVRALHMPLLSKASSCRAVHLAAAYWRWRKLSEK